ncbi:hypothetical protein JRQ81_003378 [Phrynocephalus forsythii]|uniref:Uncharacterized protein n=1 Tax=Phrynocephalus forsythii TaxID=171643 RepID=A0A9Q0XKG7_9SAUR|nr:hypothetical protein JRQ81_003378 [Phrynocephalus forsythii]
MILGKSEEAFFSSLRRGGEGSCEGAARQGAEMRQGQGWGLPRLSSRPGAQGECADHREPCNVFCTDDRAFICLVCAKSRKHRTHLILPLEEAAEECKQEIQAKLQDLKTERNAIQALQRKQKEEMPKHLGVIKAERRKMVQEFQQLHLFLEEQERRLLHQLDKLTKEMELDREQNGPRLLNTFSVLSERIRDLEEECQRPAEEFLQNLKETFSRCEIGMPHRKVEKPPDWEEALGVISQKNIVLAENFKIFKETLAAELNRGQTSCRRAVLEEPAQQLQIFRAVERGDALRTGRRVNATLDPRTANPKLLVSLDQKRVRHWGPPQALTDHSKRFDFEPFVLACEGFHWGKHCWGVKVEQGQSWAVGVARESVNRKGPISLSPEQGIWAVEQCWGQFRALTSHWTPIPLARIPRRIRVCLDYERGWVAFSDADLDAPIFTFAPVSFNQEKIYPWLWVGPGSQLSFCL